MWWTVLVLGCGGARTPVVAQPALPTSVHMQEVLDHADAARDAVVAGDVKAGRRHLGWLAEEAITTAPPPESLVIYADAVRGAAALGSGADDLMGVSGSTATMAAACGECHHKAETGPLFPAENLPPGDDLATHMDRHRWAVDRMWEGLVSPDEHRWRSGAFAFLEDPVVAEIPSMAKVHELGKEGLNTSTPADRARLFGQILGTCATCHQEHGITPSP